MGRLMAEEKLRGTAVMLAATGRVRCCSKA